MTKTAKFALFAACMAVGTYSHSRPSMPKADQATPSLFSMHLEDIVTDDIEKSLQDPNEVQTVIDSFVKHHPFWQEIKTYGSPDERQGGKSLRKLIYALHLQSGAPIPKKHITLTNSKEFREMETYHKTRNEFIPGQITHAYFSVNKGPTQGDCVVRNAKIETNELMSRILRTYARSLGVNHSDNLVTLSYKRWTEELNLSPDQQALVADIAEEFAYSGWMISPSKAGMTLLDSFTPRVYLSPSSAELLGRNIFEAELHEQRKATNPHRATYLAMQSDAQTVLTNYKNSEFKQALDGLRRNYHSDNYPGDKAELEAKLKMIILDPSEVRVLNDKIRAKRNPRSHRLMKHYSR